MHVKKGAVHGDGTHGHSGIWEMSRRTANKGAKVPSRRCMRGRWMPGISLSWGGFVLPSFPFFPCMRAGKGRGGRAGVPPLPCWVPGSLLQYRTQYSDHLASQGALWSLQWCQSEKRATPSRLARRWLPARSECQPAASSFDRNPL